ncbi:non-ribosomal peptide synthetase [Photobacterium arenosum]|uniref:non-ribosomal peptide synthetase n=1 Tax=Photobacterium arenosum TaxID=2774143 RepID=UPI00288B9F31|nr:non-ribosomal peptide synthetase [Photobacterium arenosum]
MYLLIQQIINHNMAIWLDRDEIKLAMRGQQPDQTLVTQLRSLKPQITAYLAEQGIFSQADFEQWSDLQPTPVSYGQEQLLFIEHLDAGAAAYHMPLFVSVKRGASVSRIKAALDHVVERHKLLNAVYQVGEHSTMRLLQEPISMSSQSVESADLLKERVQQAVLRPFALNEEPPFRCHHFHCESDEYLLFIWHHIAFDGWSQNIFLHELKAFYTALSEGREAALPELTSGYADFARQQRSGSIADKNAESLAYWKSVLADAETLCLPLDYTRPVQFKSEGDHVDFSLSEMLTEQLKQLAREQETTLYTILLSALYVSLECLSGQRDVVVGTPAENRPTTDTQALIGYFVNALPLRLELDKAWTTAELIHHVHQLVLNARKHQEVPFECIVDELAVERDLSQHPLFQVMFAFHSFDGTFVDDLPFDFVPSEDDPTKAYHPAKFDLHVSVQNTDNQLTGSIVFAKALFNKETVTRLVALYQQVLKNMLQSQYRSLAEYNLLSAADQHSIDFWNRQSSVTLSHSTLCQAFEHQAECFPHRIALQMAEAKLTYAQLDQASDQLAQQIRTRYQQLAGKHLSPDTLIAVYMDRSFEMVLSLLAILKAGGAYLPLTPESPDDRVQFIVDDAKPVMLLTQEEYIGKMDFVLGKTHQQPVIQTVCLPALLATSSPSKLNIINDPQDLAYVIYTSGTTGKPKGVMQTHCNVLRLFSASEEGFKFNESDTWLLYHSFSFDFSVWEIFGALLFGGRLVIPEKACIRDFSRLAQLCAQEEITVLNQTPEAFYAFSDVVLSESIVFPSLRYVIFGGDKLNIHQLKPWWNRFGDEVPKLINMYGITETTVHVTYKSLSRQDLTAQSLIGKPLSDMTAHVLDERGRPLPINAVGELFIGGGGLARGYLNRDSLTRERFIDTSQYGRLYKTGDLARWLPNGELAYVGRNDHQVKIRGHRIELGEVEQALLAIDGIKLSVVIALQRAGKQVLAAYVVMEDGCVFIAQKIADALNQSLPEYMQPASINVLNAIPLTVNGKLDRVALPEPCFSAPDQFHPPRDNLEKQLCEIWQSVLGVNRVGIQDNFFQVGGDSILAIRLLGRLSLIGLQLPLNVFYANPTISGITSGVNQSDVKSDYQAFSLLSDDKKKNLINNISDNLTDAYPATQLQQGMLLESSLSRGVYHDVFRYSINIPFDYKRFRKTLFDLIHRHETLRTAFIEDDEHGYIGVVHQHVDLVIDIVEYQDWSTLLDTQHDKPFDTTQPQLLRCIISDITTGGFELNLAIHHVILDGWSLASLVTELLNIYSSYCVTELVSNPPMGMYAESELAAMSDEESVSFWKQYLAGYEMPDFPIVSQDCPQHSELDKAVYELSDAESSAILTLSSTLNISVDTLFLAIYHHTISKIQNCDDTVIGLIANNRLEIPGGDKMLGVFLNVLPFRPQISSDMGTIADWLKSYSYEKDRVLRHKRIPYTKIKESSLKTNVTLSISFNYTHFHVYDEVSQDKRILQKGQGYDKNDIPLTLNVVRHQDRFILSLQAHKQSVSKVVFQQLHQYLGMMVNEMSKVSAQHPFHHLSRLTIEDQKRLSDWQYGTRSKVVSDSLSDLFERQVARSPEHIALVFGNKVITYKTLDEKANQLACLISEQYQQQCGQPFEAGTMVGLFYDRGIEMVIAMLAVLKAGGVYVPISPSYPDDRVGFIVSDIQSPVLLTQPALKTKLVKCLQDPGSYSLLTLEQSAQSEKYPHHRQVTESDLAYVIYTSGTTGKPKGVKVTSSSVLNLLNSEHFNTSYARCCCWTNYVFDISVVEIFSSLLNGSTLHILNDDTRSDQQRYFEYLQDYSIESAYVPPFYIGALSRWLEENTGQLHLKRVLTGVDKILPEHAAGLLKQGVVLINSYGPTETTVASTALHVTAINPEWSVIPIGKPTDNEICYVLDKQLLPVPVGTVGELYIGGAGVAQGYVNRPELTCERFLPDPYVTLAEKENGWTRIYKTGDWVRWLPDGNLEYLGRTDGQVKIRGHRIELAEIRAVLTELLQVADTTVILQTVANEPAIVAYVVPKPGCILESGSLAAWVAEKLPVYMLPQYYVVMKLLPLTINGKLDKQALPIPEVTESQSHHLPQTDLEISLAQIWQSVLGIKSIGLTDNFFYIGGHSLHAIRVLAKIKEDLQLEATIGLMFSYPTIAEIIPHLQPLAKLSAVIMPLGMSKYPLSYAQERMLFLDAYGAAGSAYNVPYLLMLDEDVGVNCLQQVLNIVVKRHTVLHSVFNIDENGNTYQQIVEAAPELVCHRCESQQEIREYTEKQSAIPFVLSKEIPIRVSLIDSPDGCYVFFLWHHIAIDGWSVDIFINDFMSCYQAMKAHQIWHVPELTINYGDYAYWQRQQEKKERYAVSQAFWFDALKNLTQLELPTDHQRPSQIDYTGNNVSINLSEEQAENLLLLAQEEGVTLHSLLLSGFMLTLSVLSRQEDIVVGIPAELRDMAEVQSLVGLFVNSLPIRVSVDQTCKGSEFIHQVHNNVVQAKSQQNLPFEKLLDVLQIPRDPSRHPIFQVMFTLEQQQERNTANIPEGEQREISGFNSAKFDLSMHWQASPGSLQGTMNFASRLFDKETIESWSKLYIHVLDQWITKSEQPMTALTWLSARDHQDLITRDIFQSEQIPYSSLPAAFEAQVSRYPERVSLEFGDKKLTYRELNNKVNQMAVYLSHCGVQRGNFVGLLLHRSMEQVITLLAVLKIGASYVPIDPVNPLNRIKYIINNAKLSYLLTHDEYSDALLGVVLSVIDVDKVLEESSFCSQVFDLKETEVTGDDTAYVIYTSGSTGEPKGVAVSHHNVLRLFRACAEYFEFSYRDTWTLFHSYAFDFSVWEIWGALLKGGRLVIVPDEIVKSAEAMVQLVSTKQVTVLSQTPSAFNLFSTEAVKAGIRNFCLRYVIFGGEALKLKKLQPWIETYGDETPQLVNMYGITETTVHVTHRVIRHSDMERLASIIGKSLSDLYTYVCDDQGRLLPQGAVGELYVGGDGVTTGYLHLPELTVQRFIPDPFSEGKGRVYRSGDLVRRIHDGELEYLGRMDHQTKLRGYRIELGEIEQVILRSKLVKDCVVLLKSHGIGEPQLIAFIVNTSKETQEIASSIRSFLLTLLPDYMIPAHYAVIPEIPLTVNGKVDRQRLLSATEIQVASAAYVEPGDEVESKLCSIWQSLLGLERVGIHDNFFAIGGDSMSVVKLVMQSSRQGLHFSIKELFEHQTVAQIAKVVRVNSNDLSSTLKPAPMALLSTKLSADDRYLAHQVGAEDIYPVSSMQALMIHHHKASSDIGIYQPQVLFSLSGLHVNVSAVTHAMKEMLEKHPTLRTIFIRSDNSEYRQLVMPADVVEISVNDADQIPHSERNAFSLAICKQEQVQKFELGSANTRVKILRYDDSRVDFMMTTHHAIEDGWGLVELLNALFSEIENNGKGIIQPKNTSVVNVFKEAVALELEAASNNTFKSQWTELLCDYSPMPHLPTNTQSTGYQKVTRSIDTLRWQKVSRVASHLGVPVKTLFLYAYHKALGNVLNTSLVTVDVVSNGRSERLSNPLDGVGLYWRFLPLTLNVGLPVEQAIEKLAKKQIQAEMCALYPVDDIAGLVGEKSLTYAAFNFMHFSNIASRKNDNEMDVRCLYSADRFHHAIKLSLNVDPVSKQINAEVDYNSCYVSSLQSECIMTMFEGLLKQILSMYETQTT